ncbi:DUF2267 domain-containing protein [Geodermatophilus ruber]|uniref:Uncharacterized conserved protein, DUF2267 family n=1 Tax=Geodermatophilus ruber TaxID=504800 RepID=A0A1I4A551_9ACTN|nr:DUF2267 domain-containing protein [Geodermatophilus ruber]SFK51247.1 Uncharacterized conserved protein, DUF2267 family [Geodermatophilus ruber]
MQTFERFRTAVRLGTGWDRRTADHGAQSVLVTLFERITGGQAADVAQQLSPPDGFLPQPLMERSRPAERFGVEEFLRRVAEREHVDTEAARLLTSTVLNALGLVIPHKEWKDTVAQLPTEFEQLWSIPWRPRHPLQSAADLLDPVGARSGLSTDEARRVADAVLHILAECLSVTVAGELAQRLPDDLRAPLEQGLAHRSAPLPFTPENFLKLLAVRLGTDPQSARERARAVLQVLVEEIDDSVLADLLAELPADFDDLLVPTPSRAGSV